MITRKTYISSFSFSFVSGIINILGIQFLGLVVTNVTGHYSTSILSNKTETYKDILITSSYIFMYWLGSFWASSCFYYGKKTDKAYIKALPIFLNLIILLYALWSQNLVVWLLFLVSSTQNAFGANHSENQIRASQITGVVMASGLDMAKYFFGGFSADCRKDFLKAFSVKMLNIIGFIVGGIASFFYSSLSILWLPVAFYCIVSVLILKKKL
ncbi:DUF1275 family protein [Arcicella aquatica]|uniref:DUF1275 family protein n=1 Tax=Arcicella aquatica TaxID=217141 RepID=A0ABU5QN76_9BACT|nr:DUF1275 family protein [Arcicella aquatica]MEA5257886.1 DUF1275 family protein [Arcicella aquatica]